MANIRNRRMDDPEGANSRIFVGNIPMDTDREILKKKFEGHGPVLGVMVLKGFAFVQFQVEAHAKAAIETENGTEFNGKKLDVKPAKQNNKGGGGGGMGGQQAPWQEQQGGGHHNFRGGGGGGHRGSRGGRGGGDQTTGPGWGRGVTRGAFGGNRGHFGGHNQGFGGGGGNRGGFNGPGGWGGDGGGGYSDYGDNSEYSEYGDTGYSEEYDEMGDMERFNERLQAEDDDAGYGGQAGGYGGGFANTRGRGRGGGSNPGRGRGGGLNHAGGGNNGVQHQHPPAEQEKPNDVEIIAMDKSLRVYGENLESRLQNMGLSVDILFPNPDIPVGKVLGNIASRGVMFAICLTPDNREHGSVTLNVLQGQQQEHRNMPVDDAMSFISKQFPSLAGGPGPGAGNSVISRPGSSVVPAPSASGHPPDVQKIITFLSDDRPLSIMEYDKMIKYLVSRRTETLKEEYGDNIPAHLQHPPVGPQLDPAKKAKQEEIQNRVQTILRERRDGGRAPGAGMAPSLQAAIDSLVKNGPNLLSGVSQPQPQAPSSSYSYQSQSHPGPASSRDYSSGTGGFGRGFGNY